MMNKDYGYSTHYAVERDLIEMINKIKEDYMRAIQPYVDRLAALQALKPLPPTIVTTEQAQRMGLIK